MGGQWTVAGFKPMNYFDSHNVLATVGNCHQPNWNDPLYRLSMLHIRLWSNQKWQL